MEQVYHYHSDIQEIPKIREDLAVVAKKWEIPPSEMGQIKLIIEEIFSNIIRFAYQDQKAHMVEIRLEKEEMTISIEITDDGIPFNPLEHRSTTFADPASMDSGGMGLTLIRTFSDAIRYARAGTLNRLTIVKKIKSKP